MYFYLYYRCVVCGKDNYMYSERTGIHVVGNNEHFLFFSIVFSPKCNNLRMVFYRVWNILTVLQQKTFKNIVAKWHKKIFFVISSFVTINFPHFVKMFSKFVCWRFVDLWDRVTANENITNECILTLQSWMWLYFRCSV